MSNPRTARTVRPTLGSRRGMACLLGVVVLASPVPAAAAERPAAPVVTVDRDGFFEPAVDQAYYLDARVTVSRGSVARIRGEAWNGSHWIAGPVTALSADGSAHVEVTPTLLGVRRLRVRAVALDRFGRSLAVSRVLVLTSYKWYPVAAEDPTLHVADGLVHRRRYEIATALKTCRQIEVFAAATQDGDLGSVGTVTTTIASGPQAGTVLREQMVETEPAVDGDLLFTASLGPEPSISGQRVQIDFEAGPRAITMSSYAAILCIAPPLPPTVTDTVLPG